MENLRIIREVKGKSQAYLADVLGISQSEISSYESGRRSPRPDVLIELADILSTSTDYLLGITDDPTPVRFLNKDKLSNEEQDILKMYAKFAVEDKINLLKYMQKVNKKR